MVYGEQQPMVNFCTRFFVHVFNACEPGHCENLSAPRNGLREAKHVQHK
jgi:hypothetical protein